MTDVPSVALLAVDYLAEEEFAYLPLLAYFFLPLSYSLIPLTLESNPSLFDYIGFGDYLHSFC